MTSESRFDVQPSVGNHFAWLRTQMGLERTLMAAVRTSVSLIGLGFTVAQFFQRLQESAVVRGPISRVDAPRNMGLVLISAGLVSAVMFVRQFHVASSYLRSGPFEPIAGIERRSMRGSVYLTACAVILIGLAAFAAVWVRF